MIGTTLIILFQFQILRTRIPIYLKLVTARTPKLGHPPSSCRTAKGCRGGSRPSDPTLRRGTRSKRCRMAFCRFHILLTPFHIEKENQALTLFLWTFLKALYSLKPCITRGTLHTCLSLMVWLSHWSKSLQEILLLSGLCSSSWDWDVVKVFQTPGANQCFCSIPSMAASRGVSFKSSFSATPATWAGTLPWRYPWKPVLLLLASAGGNHLKMGTSTAPGLLTR